MHDLVVRNGTVADGSGGPLRRADVAIEAERIVAVAEGVGRGREEIDAEGALVAPGWVGIRSTEILLGNGRNQDQARR